MQQVQRAKVQSRRGDSPSRCISLSPPVQAANAPALGRHLRVWALPLRCSPRGCSPRGSQHRFLSPSSFRSHSPPTPLHGQGYRQALGSPESLRRPSRQRCWRELRREAVGRWECGMVGWRGSGMGGMGGIEGRWDGGAAHPHTRTLASAHPRTWYSLPHCSLLELTLPRVLFGPVPYCRVSRVVWRRWNGGGAKVGRWWGESEGGTKVGR